MKKKKFEVTGDSGVYRFLWAHVTFFIWRFYREFKVKGAEKLPYNESIILAPNHQSAFMDAIILINAYGKTPQLSFLVRASIFKAKVAKWAFSQINLLPVYRKDFDGVENMDKNDAIFENCIYLLENKRPLVLFPEGTHNLKRQLIPVKKGVARIAFNAEERCNQQLGIKIFPIGITYSHQRKFNERVFINIGDPIVLSEYRQLYIENPAKAQLQIKNELERRMRDLMIDIRSHEYYETIERLREITTSEKGITDIESNFHHSKKLIASVEKYFAENKEAAEQMKADTSRYYAELSTFGFMDKIFSPVARVSNKIFDVLLLVLFAPVYVYGVFHNLVPFLAPGWIIKKMIKDPGFHSSIKVLTGLVFFPVMHVIWCTIFYLVTGSFWYTVIYWLSLIASGEIALWYHHVLVRLCYQNKFEKFKKTEKYTEIMNLRNTILKNVPAY